MPTNHNKKLGVTIFDKNRKKVVVKAHPLLPQFLDFLWLLIGKKWVGKTTFALSLFLEYQDDFDYFYVVSPTAEFDDKFDDFELSGKNLFGEKKILQVVNDFKKLPQLIDKVKAFRQNGVGKGKNRKFPKTIIFIDDPTGDTGHISETSEFGKFAVQARHFNTALIVALHRPFTQFIKYLRDLSEIITVFGLVGEQLVKDIVKENFLQHQESIIELIGDSAKIPHDNISFFKRENKVIRNLGEEVVFT